MTFRSLSKVLARHPLMVAMTACLLVIFGFVALARARRSPKVTVSIGAVRRVATDSGGPRLAEPPFRQQVASIPSVQTATGIESAQALALGLWGTAFAEADAGNFISNYPELERAATQRGLIPGTVTSVQPGIYQADERQLLVRFRPKPLAVEIVVPATETAPPLIVRIPAQAKAGYFDDDPSKRITGGTRPVAWFVGHLRTAIPEPFITVDDLVLRGWRPEAGNRREEETPAVRP